MAISPGNLTLSDSERPGIEEPIRHLVRRDEVTESDPPERLHRPSHVAPTIAAQCEAHAHAALGASVRTEARLGALFRAIQHFSAGVSDAREANDELARDLERLRDLLTASNEQQAELRYRVSTLELALSRTEQQAAREREFLMDQQDAFIQMLCQDQERDLQELLKLRLERDQLVGDLDRVQAQRDEAQAAVVRIASERDQALIELSRTRSSERPRLSAGPKSEPLAQPVAKLELEALPQKGPPTSSPTASSSSSGGGPASQVPISKPPLKSKPDPSTRPLIGYSLAGDDLAEETLEGTKISPRPQER